MRIAALTLLGVVTSVPAFAADLGTYRPGTPYHSVIAAGADVCESQCAGDARCRGWNYVKAAPKAPGVCEFQSQVGAPVSSAISISGISSNAGPVSNRIVAGGTNTVRVGTSVASKTEPRQASGQRRIVREPVPTPQARGQAGPVQAATYRRPSTPVAVPQSQQTQPQPRQMPARPQFQPMLDGQQRRPVAPQNYRQQSYPGHPMPQTNVAPTPAPVAVPRGPARQARHMRGGPRPVISHSQPYGGYTQPNAPRPQPNATSRPPIGQPITPPVMAGSANVPPQPPTQQAMPRASAANPVGFDTAQQSLFGSLHDDVQVPASNMPMPEDPNAPIPTSMARPVQPVVQAPLGPPAR